MACAHAFGETCDSCRPPKKKRQTDMSSVGEEFPVEQKRCRELLEQYTSIGPAGALGHAAISAVLERADEAAISGDVIAMLRSFEELKGCS